MSKSETKAVQDADMVGWSTDQEVYILGYPKDSCGATLPRFIRKYFDKNVYMKCVRAKGHQGNHKTCKKNSPVRQSSVRPPQVKSIFNTTPNAETYTNMLLIIYTSSENPNDRKWAKTELVRFVQKAMGEPIMENPYVRGMDEVNGG
jgi:hypothetical protein